MKIKKTVLPFRTGWAYNKVADVTNAALDELASSKKKLTSAAELHKSNLAKLKENRTIIASLRKENAALNKVWDTKQKKVEEAEGREHQQRLDYEKSIARLAAQVEKHKKAARKMRAKKKKKS